MGGAQHARELEMAYRSKNGRRRAVRLPTAEQIKVEGERRRVTITMTCYAPYQKSSFILPARRIASGC
jgi:hypothetical protein